MNRTALIAGWSLFFGGVIVLGPWVDTGLLALALIPLVTFLAVRSRQPKGKLQ